MPQRFAIYFAPAVTDALWDRASIWLGRDSATGELFEGAVAGIDRGRLLNLTQSAGRYGFHATIRSPMALEAGADLAQLQHALAQFAAETAPVDLGRLAIASLDNFLALVHAADRTEQVQDFAGRVVEAFEPFRAPLSARDQAARLARGLTPRQAELLDAYGYPYVFDQFQFHMTLTDRLAEPDHDDISRAADTWFAPALDQPFILDRLALYHEPEVGRPFRRLSDYILGG